MSELDPTTAATLAMEEARRRAEQQRAEAEKVAAASGPVPPPADAPVEPWMVHAAEAIMWSRATAVPILGARDLIARVIAGHYAVSKKSADSPPKVAHVAPDLQDGVRVGMATFPDGHSEMSLSVPCSRGSHTVYMNGEAAGAFARRVLLVAAELGTDVIAPKKPAASWSRWPEDPPRAPSFTMHSAVVFGKLCQIIEETEGPGRSIRFCIYKTHEHSVPGEKTVAHGVLRMGVDAAIRVTEQIAECAAAEEPKKGAAQR